MATCIPKLTTATLAVLMLAACSQNGTITEVHELENGKSLLTSADVRVVNQYKVKSGSTPGRVDPEYITCAEPSPDVAKVVANAFALSGSVDVSGLPSDVQPKVAAAISRSRAESIAQLGERLGTIQLLRDGLYRACESYANGAISDTTYAVMLSRYDDTMVTMLTAELAAGAFGRSLAALGSEAGASSKTTADIAEKRVERREAEATLKEKKIQSREIEFQLKNTRTQRDEVKGQLDQASKSGADQSETHSLQEELDHSTKEVEKLEKEFESSTKQIENAEEDLQTKLTAEATSNAKASATAAGTIKPGQQNWKIAATLHTMQRKFIENINSDAIEVACISALDRSDNMPPTRLAQFCTTNLLPDLIRAKSVLLGTVLERRRLEVENEQRRARFVDTLAELQTLLVKSHELRQNMETREVKGSDKQIHTLLNKILGAVDKLKTGPGPVETKAEGTD